MNKSKHLIISSIIFSIIIILWPLFMALLPPAGSTDMQFSRIIDHLVIHRLQFFIAFLISPAIIYLMTAQAVFLKRPGELSSRIGALFLGGYLVLSSLSYASQIVIVPAWIEKGYFQLAEIWHFGNQHSIAYFMNQTGYLFWAVSAVVLFPGLLSEKGLVRWIGILYLASAVLTFVAFTGLLIDNLLLNSLTLFSGLLLLPVGILSVIESFRLNSGASS